MSFDQFDGDPKLIVTKNGSTLKYVNGQPVMDQGFENQVNISLLTTSWIGNIFFDNESERIGSEFEEATKKTITLSSLTDIERKAEEALVSIYFGSIIALVTNPVANKLDVNINIKPNVGEGGNILLSNNGNNWISQAKYPANERI